MSYEGDGAVVPEDNQLTEVRKNVEQMPIISGEIYQHVGRFAGAIVMSVFEQIGGVNRMAAWADASPDSFYTKVFPKMIQRSQSVDITASVTIDDAISRLENVPIEGKFTRNPDPPIFDL